jgi:hypothetical protein
MSRCICEGKDIQFSYGTDLYKHRKLYMTCTNGEEIEVSFQHLILLP